MAKHKLQNLVADLSAITANALESVEIRRHRTPKSIWLAMLDPMMKEVGERDPNQMLLNGSMGIDEVESMMSQMGFWGFCEPKAGVVHVWTDGTVNQVQLMAFIAHELEHLIYRHQSKWKVNGTTLEERRCDLTGAIAARAFEIVSELVMKRSHGMVSHRTKAHRKTIRQSAAAT